jgi:hypothetical protein
MEESKKKSWVRVINFDPASGFPYGFLGFFLGNQGGSGFPLASSSLEGTGTSSG